MTRSPRPVLVHLSPLAAVGGCEINCLRLVSEMREFHHRVLVFDGPGPMTEQWQAAGAEVEHLSAWTGGVRAFAEALARWTAERPTPAGVFYWSVSRLPVVINQLRDWAPRLVVHLGNPVDRRLVPAVRRWVQERLFRYPLAVALAACSEKVARTHGQAAFFRRFPCRVIYNAVPAEFDGAHEHRTSGPLRVGMVARLDSIKDHRTLLQAMARVQRLRPDVTLELAGDGALRAPLEAEATRLGVTRAVRFLGFVPVRPLLTGWDIYVHSTTRAEGMGTAVAEAMMAGLPCVVTDLPVMREVCGDTAMYAVERSATSWADAILGLIAGVNQRTLLGAAAQVRARKMFSAAECARQYLEMVREPEGVV